VLKAAQALTLPVLEVSLTPAQARDADELFIAVTTRDIIPVITFDGQTIGSGKPGPWTLRLQEAFQNFVVV
jgi:branched-subunit amino acid aminotransferase/4-amino-4-deoxychorismate lyase